MTEKKEKGKSLRWMVSMLMLLTSGSIAVMEDGDSIERSRSDRDSSSRVQIACRFVKIRTRF